MRARASDIALAAGVGGGGGGGAGGAGGGGDANGGHGGAGGPHDDAGGADDHNNDGDVGGDDVGPGLYGYFPSSSLAPGHKTPVLLRDGESGKRSLRVMKWGLVSIPNRPGGASFRVDDNVTWLLPCLVRLCRYPASRRRMRVQTIFACSTHAAKR